MKITQNIIDLIGSTPLISVSRFGFAYNVKATLLAKLEGENPAGSAKDRVGAAMIAAAEAAGQLCSGATIIEPTSGNTGIGLASIATVKGYRMILTMPDTMSVERRKIMAAYGAEVVLSPTKEGMTGAIRMAEELAKKYPHSFIPGQFENPANPAAHYAATGPEIWEDTEGSIDIFVAGAGTGGEMRSIHPLIARPPDCFNMAATQFFPQAADMHVDGMGIAFALVAPYLVHELQSCKNLLGGGEKCI